MGYIPKSVTRQPPNIPSIKNIITPSGSVNAKQTPSTVLILTQNPNFLHILQKYFTFLGEGFFKSGLLLSQNCSDIKDAQK